MNKLKLISHRGNISGKSELENTPNQIDNSIIKGFDVEIDLWVIDNTLFLGHDSPDYEISFNYLIDRKEYLWIHCKNESALFFLQNSDLNYFWHQEDCYTITSKGFIWTYPNKQTSHNKNQIILDFDPITEQKLLTYANKIFGICSDDFKFL